MLHRLLIAAALAILSGTSASAQALTLQKLADYPLPGDTSRYDYLSFDPTSNRMYIAHLGQGVIHVFDTQAKKLVGRSKAWRACMEFWPCPSLHLCTPRR